MERHYTAEGEPPSETVHGEDIEYVWLVCRRARDSASSGFEVLGVWTDESDAVSHAKNADRKGPTLLRREQLRDEMVKI